VPHVQAAESGMTLVLRSAAPPAEVARALRDAVSAADPDVPVSSLRSGADLVEAAVAERRFASRLLGLFALAAVGLVAVGLVGALAQVVSTRTREIGVRLVLGARRSQVLALLTAALACVVPAWRAARVDPALVLRGE
jgi:ABC-type antimicrobial peptide transport system permease subunit